MELINTVNTFEEEVRNRIIHIINKDLQINDLLIISGALAKQIYLGETEAATNILWMYSTTGCKIEYVQEIINLLEQTLEEAL